MRYLLMIAFFISMNVLAAEEKKQEEVKISELPSVIEAKEKYIKSLEQPKKDYLKVIDTQEEISTKKGDLDSVTAIQKERKDIDIEEPKKSTIEWNDKQLLASQKKFNLSVDASKTAYFKDLNNIIVEATKAKNIKLAEKMKAYIEDLKLEDLKILFCGEWKRENVTIVINSNLTWQCLENNQGGFWVYENGEIITKTTRGNDLNWSAKIYCENGKYIYKSFYKKVFKQDYQMVKIIK